MSSQRKRAAEPAQDKDSLMRQERQAAADDVEELEYEDPYGDEYDDEDVDDVGEDMDLDEEQGEEGVGVGMWGTNVGAVGEGEGGQQQQVWRPGVDSVAEG
ncbi:hypothetical protein EON64_19595, partial [archaeon]